MDTQFSKQIVACKRQAMERYYSRMNDVQKQAVFQVDGPLLILAGAGSGKTTVLINRIDNMVRFGDVYNLNDMPGSDETTLSTLQSYLDGGELSSEALATAVSADPIKPWNILAITFTNKAAAELRTRLSEQLGEVANDIRASTFHSLCVRILRRDISALGYSSSFTIYDSDDSQRLIRDGIRAVGLDEKIFQTKGVLSAIGSAKDSLLSPEDMQNSSDEDYRKKSIAKVYAYYQKQLKNANALDFDDIILLTVRLFQQFPEKLEYYQNRWKYIMVDEYQDTNHTQYTLISLLADKNKNLCVVGDDDQSIYKFRGATIENILSFENQFNNAKVIRLEENYRSTQNILSAANQLIQNNKGRKGKNLWTSAGDGELIKVYRLRDESEESRMIADAVLDNVKNGAKFSDHAVLYRINAQSNAVERALAKNAIPYRIVGGLRFYERKEIKDIVAYLSVLENPGDTLRLLRVINEPKRGIGNSTLSTAIEIAENTGITLFEVISGADGYPTLAKKAPSLMEFATLLIDLAKMAQERPLIEVLDSLLERTGYIKMLESQGFEGAGRLENIMELKTNMFKYCAENEEPTLSGFLEEIALYTDLDNYDQDADAMVLMTIHSAKGLEFPWVFISGMDEGIFPGRSAMSNEDEIEEERRLAYVAITRAKQHLTIMSTERRMLFGQTVYGRFSRFIGEIPQELIELHDMVALRPKPSNTQPPASRKRSAGSAASIGVGAAPPAAVQPSAQVREGDQVSHKVFGEGKVVSAKAMGNDTLVEIQFEKVGTKKVMANFARLTKI